jgi:hypothetical protein
LPVSKGMMASDGALLHRLQVCCMWKEKHPRPRTNAVEPGLTLIIVLAP